MALHPATSVHRAHVIAVVVFATLCVSAGETLLRAGMKQVGDGRHEGFGFVLAAMTNGHVIVGTLLMMTYFSLYALALSWADISFVLPITGLSYLFVACFARVFLQEVVTPTRWLGAIIITIGVIVVGRGE